MSIPDELMPVSMTFPADVEATGRILDTDPMARMIAEIHADGLDEYPDRLDKQVAGKRITVTAGQLGLDKRPDPGVVEIEASVKYDPEK